MACEDIEECPNKIDITVFGGPQSFICGCDPKRLEVKKSGKSLPQVAYEAYGDFVGWVTYLGAKMPPWGGLTDKVRGGWQAATEVLAGRLRTPVTEGGIMQPQNPVPSIGRVVLVIVDPARNNGNDIAHAYITNVHSVNTDACHVVNYRIMYDTEYPPQLVTSAFLCPDEDTARNCGAGVPSAAYWPPRV